MPNSHLPVTSRAVYRSQRQGDGSMIFELRSYELAPGKTARYIRHFEEVGLPIVSRHCTLVGYWLAETGRLNKVLHLWSFADLEARRRAREAWMADADWGTHFLPAALQMVVSQETVILTAAPFSPIR
jgi:hypothetical protein